MSSCSKNGSLIVVASAAVAATVASLMTLSIIKNAHCPGQKTRHRIKASKDTDTPTKPKSTTKPNTEFAVQRTKSYPLASHNHGKLRVRVLKVDSHEGKHSVYEYEVSTTLFCDDYEKCFTDGDNTDLVATDTQKNTVYYIAKKKNVDSPEIFGVELCSHFLKTYPFLSGSEAHVKMTKWNRIQTQSQPHSHGFEHGGNETYEATVRSDRTKDDEYYSTRITSFIKNMVVLKTTQSGFEGYFKDRFTLLPECTERCMATSCDCEWTYDPHKIGVHEHNFNDIRKTVREQLLQGFFGPPTSGIYSGSLQATIYDMACLILQNVDCIWSVKLNTPNLHYLPTGVLLREIGETFEDDVFIPTSEPSGSITCTVLREDWSKGHHI